MAEPTAEPTTEPTREPATDTAADVAPILRGKVILISGIGPGLGRSLAVRSARAGADVVLAARTEARLAEVAKEVTDCGRRAVTVAADVTDESSARRLVETALEAFGRVDGLVNNAFAMPPMVDLGDVDLDALRQSFETNVFAALRLTRLLAPALAESRGSVVMVNSAVLRHSRQPYGPYKLAKTALLSLAQSLASELGPTGVRVNSVAPGWIWADTLKWYFGYLAEQRGVTADDVYKETAAPIDLRRLPEPDEIADAVSFLLSDLARAVTGQCLDVNCGEYHH
jgi:NAD(P)-dependent dehydrogenase (short-subunit alcohol dehydrogenase family)